MQFSDTTDYTGIIQDVDFLLFGDGTTQNADYTIEDRTRAVNITYDWIVDMLFKADPNFQWDDTTNVNFPIATTTLVANQGSYLIPDGSLIITRLRIHDKSGNLKTLDPVQRRELSDSELQETGEPSKYFKIDNAIFPIPVPDYGGVAGVELQYQRAQTYFVKTDTTKKPGFASIFHYGLSAGAAHRYALANGMKEKADYLSEVLQRLEQDIREHYQRRSPDRKPSLILKKRSVNTYGL